MARVAADDKQRRLQKAEAFKARRRATWTLKFSHQTGYYLPNGHHSMRISQLRGLPDMMELMRAQGYVGYGSEVSHALSACHYAPLVARDHASSHHPANRVLAGWGAGGERSQETQTGGSRRATAQPPCLHGAASASAPSPNATTSHTPSYLCVTDRRM